MVLLLVTALSCQRASDVPESAEALPQSESSSTLKVGPQTSTMIASIEQLFQRGEHQAGLELARKIDHQVPGTPRIRYLIGAMTGALGEHRDAIEHFEAELRLDPNHVGSLLGLATAYTNLSESAAAQPPREQALALEPENPAILLRLGQNQAALGQLEESDELISKARTIAAGAGPSAAAGGFPEMLADIDYELGELARQRRDFVTAEASFRRALFENSQHTAATYGLGQSLLRQGKAEEAEAILLRFERLSQFDSKFGELLEVSRRQPPPAGVFQGLARYQRTRGDLEAAKASYHRSLELAPGQATSAYGLASILLDQDRLDEATRWALYALAQEPKNWRSHFWQGRVRLARGQVDDAERAFEASRSLGSWPAGNHLSLAKAYRAQDQLDLARAYVERGLAAAPESVNLLWEMAFIDLLQSQQESAEAWVHKALEVAPGHANSLMLAGLGAHRAGRTRDAARDFEAARFAQRANHLGMGQEEEWLEQFAALPGSDEALDLYRRGGRPTP